MSNLQGFIKTGNKLIEHDTRLKKEAFWGAVATPLLKTMLSRYATNLGIMSIFNGIGSEDGFIKGVGKGLLDPTTHLMTAGTMVAAPALVRGTGLLGKGLEKISPEKMKGIGRSMQWFSDDKYRVARSEALKRIGMAGEGGKVGNVKGIFSSVDKAKMPEYNAAFKEVSKNLDEAMKKAPKFTERSARVNTAAKDLGYGYDKGPGFFTKFFKNTEAQKPNFKAYGNTFADNNLFNPYGFSLAGTAAAAAGVPLLSAPAQLNNAMYSQDLYKGVLNMGDANRYNQWYTF